MEGGQEPGEAAEPGGAGGEIEAGAEGVEGGRARQSASVAGGGGYRCGEGEGGAGGLEESGGAAGEFPAGGSDFDELVSGVGEVEDDLVGEATGADASDTAIDGPALAGFVGVCLAFEEVEDGVELAGGGQGVELAVACVSEPFAEAGGADGDGVAPCNGVAAIEGLEAEEGLAPCNGVAIGGGEGVAAAGEVDHFGE